MGADIHDLQLNVDRARKCCRDLAMQGNFTVTEFMREAKEELVQINLARFLLEQAQR